MESTIASIHRRLPQVYTASASRSSAFSGWASGPRLDYQELLEVKVKRIVVRYSGGSPRFLFLAPAISSVQDKKTQNTTLHSLVDRGELWLCPHCKRFFRRKYRLTLPLGSTTNSYSHSQCSARKGKRINSTKRCWKIPGTLEMDVLLFIGA